MTSPRRRFPCKGIVVLLALIALVTGMYLYQRHYINEHLPQIRARMAKADAEGGALMAGFGAPPGAIALSEVEKSIGKGGLRSRTWRDVPYNITWTCTWDAPGTHDSIRAWYEQQLLGDGWKVFNQRVPTTLQTEYWKDKWLLSLEQLATFSTDHPPHARFGLRLKWDYWHELEAASAAYANQPDTAGQKP